MKRERVETLAGNGTVSKADGSVIGERAYALTVWADILSDGHGGETPRVTSTEGRISVQGPEGTALLGQNLILELEDGRLLPFFFMDANGKICPRGDLRK